MAERIQTINTKCPDVDNNFAKQPFKVKLSMKLVEGVRIGENDVTCPVYVSGKCLSLREPDEIAMYRDYVTEVGSESIPAVAMLSAFPDCMLRKAINL